MKNFIVELWENGVEDIILLDIPSDVVLIENRRPKEIFRYKDKYYILMAGDINYRYRLCYSKADCVEQ